MDESDEEKKWNVDLKIKSSNFFFPSSYKVGVNIVDSAVDVGVCKIFLLNLGVSGTGLCNRTFCDSQSILWRKHWIHWLLKTYSTACLYEEYNFTILPLIYLNIDS